MSHQCDSIVQLNVLPVRRTGQENGRASSAAALAPADWNAGVFSMIRQISETAILPIAGVILTFVMTYELIQMLIDRNNLHDVDTWMFFKWVFKTFAIRPF